MENATSPLAPGRPFGGAFTLLRPLGAGGAASVWLAREDALGREVALKVPARTDPAARGRFLDEARALAAVRHPGVVAVLRWGEDPATGLPFFAMPVHPATLADRFAREPRLSEADTAALGLALVPALAALHAAGIAHRDLKPSNVLLDASGAPVLADPCGPRGGTPAWAAPEQLASPDPSSCIVHSASCIGAVADWHALGLLLYRALAGALPPPRGILPDAVEPPRGSLPRDLRPRPSRGWEPLLCALLDPDPARRLADPAAILRALRRLRRRALVRARLRRLRRPALVALAALAAAALLATVLRAAVGFVPSGSPVPAPSPAKDWTRQYADNLRKRLAAVLPNPAPDSENRIVVPAGSLLLSGDIPSAANPPTIVLDGGTLLFSPGIGALREIAGRCDRFLSEAPDTATGTPDVLPARREWLANPILVTARGGFLDTADGEIHAFVTNSVRLASGAESATLDVFGFSSIILDRNRLDPELSVTGCGSVADFLPDGRVRNRRWFDPEEPL